MIPEYFAYFSIFFCIIGSYYYIKDTIHGKTRPNRVTWIFWSLAPLVAVYVGYKSGISLPLLASTFTAGFSPLLIVVASFFNKNSYWRITKFDILCGALSFIAIIIWVVTKNGIISLIFAILADLFAGIPTIIKSWKHSETETAGPYTLGILSQTITLLVIPNLSFQNYAFPLYIILANTIIVSGIKKNLFIRGKI